jgi:hypothetical protein
LSTIIFCLIQKSEKTIQLKQKSSGGAGSLTFLGQAHPLILIFRSKKKQKQVAVPKFVFTVNRAVRVVKLSGRY